MSRGKPKLTRAKIDAAIARSNAIQDGTFTPPPKTNPRSPWRKSWASIKPFGPSAPKAPT